MLGQLGLNRRLASCSSTTSHGAPPCGSYATDLVLPLLLHIGALDENFGHATDNNRVTENCPTLQ